MTANNHTRSPSCMHLVGEIVFTRYFFDDDEPGACNIKIDDVSKELPAKVKHKAIEDYIAAQTQSVNCNHNCEQCSSPCGCGSCYFFDDEITMNGGSLLFLAQADNKDNIILFNQTTFPMPFLMAILKDLLCDYADPDSND